MKKLLITIFYFSCLYGYSQLNVNARLRLFSPVSSFQSSDTLSVPTEIPKMWYDFTTEEFRALKRDGTKLTFGEGSSSGVSFPLLAPDGSATDPSYSFTNLSNSGLFIDAGTNLNLRNQGGSITIFSNTNTNISAGTNSDISLSSSTGTTSLFSSDINIQAFNDIVIESITPLGNVIIDGLTYPNADGTNGQVLTTDGSGQLVFQDAEPSFPLLAPDGVAANPSYSFTNLSNAGLFVNGVTTLNLNNSSGAINVTPLTTFNANSPGNTSVNSSGGNATLSASSGTVLLFGSNTNVQAINDVAIQSVGAGNVIIDGLTYPDSDGTNGQVLTTNGSGTLSFQDVGTVVTSFVPEFTGSVSNPTVTYTNQSSIYRVENNQIVHLEILLAWSSFSGGSGNLLVDLPIDQLTGTQAVGTNLSSGLNVGNNNKMAPRILLNTDISFVETNYSTSTLLTTSDVQNSGNIQISITYFIGT